MNNQITSNPLIKVTDLSVRSNRRTILQNINLQIFDSEIIIIIGPNGAGKSTLIKTILGFIKGYTGYVTRSPNLRIGYIPQQTLFPEHIPINVITFLNLNNKNSKVNKHNNNINITDTTIDNIYQNLGLELNHTLNINHLLNKSIHSLSGGELQRVLLTKALLNEPNLLVLDEPTKSIDINGQVEFYNLCASLQKKINCAILMASHDLHFVMSEVNYVVCLNQHICCQGLPESISKEQEFIKLFGANLNKLAFYNHRHNHQHNLNGEITS